MSPTATAATISESQKAWAAGFFEGEGTVSIARRWTDDTFSLRVSATGVDPSALKVLQSLWGGSLGTIKGRGREATRREAWVWTLQAQGAMAFLCDVGPHFTSDRQIARAMLALHFQRGRHPGANRSDEERARQFACFTRMRVLNARGVRGIQPSGRRRLERTA